MTLPSRVVSASDQPYEKIVRFIVALAFTPATARMPAVLVAPCGAPIKQDLIVRNPRTSCTPSFSTLSATEESLCRTILLTSAIWSEERRYSCAVALHSVGLRMTISRTCSIWSLNGPPRPTVASNLIGKLADLLQFLQQLPQTSSHLSSARSLRC